MLTGYGIQFKDVVLTRVCFVGDCDILFWGGRNFSYLLKILFLFLLALRHLKHLLGTCVFSFSLDTLVTCLQFYWDKLGKIGVLDYRNPSTS